MSIDNEWLLDNLSGAYTIGNIDDSVDSLISSFDDLISKIENDKRNYMLEAVSTMKEKLITSRVSNLMELTDPSSFVGGDEYNITGIGLSIIASKYIDAGGNADTLATLKQKMSADFESKTILLDSVASKGFRGETNTLSVNDLAASRDAIGNTADVTATVAHVEKFNDMNENSVINYKSFLERYIPFSSVGSVDNFSCVFGQAVDTVRIRGLNVSEIEMNISDAELTGSGSKMTDFQLSQTASPASNYRDEFYIVLNYGNNYSVTVNGTQYTYTADVLDTAEDIADALMNEIAADTSISTGTELGYHSITPENGNGDRVIGWYAEDTDDSVTYEVEMVVPADVSDLTIEQDATNPEKIIITFEHDGFDPVYPTNDDIISLVNSFADVPIRAVLMPGFNGGDEYNTADSFTLEHGYSKIYVEASSQITTSADVAAGEVEKIVKLHISDYSPQLEQAGTIEVVKFNPSDVFEITIDGTTITVDPSAPENSDVIDEITLASKFVTLINSQPLGVTASSTGATITLTGANGGNAYSVTTSGENNYVVPVPRTVTLKYDLRNIPNVTSSAIPSLYKDNSTVLSMREPLTKNDLDRVISSGAVMTEASAMLPTVPDVADKTDNFVAPVLDAAIKLESLVRRESDKIATAHMDISPVVRSFPVLHNRLNATEQAKTSRWFFAEAGSNGTATSSSLDVAMSTISPADYERLVLQDQNATFSSARTERLPISDTEFESIRSLLMEDTINYNKAGLLADIPFRESVYSTDGYAIITSEMTQEQIDGFIKYAILPKIVKGTSGSGEYIYTMFPDDLYRALMELAIQIDDSYMEQRFIALASSYAIDASKIVDFFADSKFASFVFGVDEAETPPENNYGLGGVPIDSTVTMSKLYFRNMRNQAMPVPTKAYSGPVNTDDKLIALAVAPRIAINTLTGNVSVRMRGTSDVISDSGDLRYYSPVPSISSGVDNLETMVDDSLYAEIARTGYFSSDIDLRINHSQTGITKKFEDTAWATIMDAIEIAGDGSIVSINSAKSYLQTLYQSFSLSKAELTAYMLGYDVASDSFESDRQRNQYSALTTLYLKILLFALSSGTSYADLQALFEEKVGLIFMDDEFEIDVLEFSHFLIWMCGIGAHNAFGADASTIVSDVSTYLNSISVDANSIKSAYSITVTPGSDAGTITESVQMKDVELPNGQMCSVPTLVIEETV